MKITLIKRYDKDQETKLDQVKITLYKEQAKNTEIIRSGYKLLQEVHTEQLKIKAGIDIHFCIYNEHMFAIFL